MIKKKLFVFLLGAFLSFSHQCSAVSGDSMPSVTKEIGYLAKDIAYGVGGCLAGGVVGFSVGYCFADTSQAGGGAGVLYLTGLGLLIGAAIGVYKAQSSYASNKEVSVSRTIFNAELL